MEGKAYFNTREVLSLLNITKNDLYTIMRPVRSKGKILPPVFTPESQNKLTTNWIFTHRDIMKLRRYFKALKEYQAAREDLRKTSAAPDKSWLKDEED